MVSAAANGALRGDRPGKPGVPIRTAAWSGSRPGATLPIAFAGLLLAAAGTAQAAGTGHAAAMMGGTPSASFVADCDTASTARTLLPAGRTATDARAYWLDATHLQWPGKPADGRYRLVRSDRAALHAEPGLPVRGADAVLPLRPDAAPLPADVAARFAFVPPGARLLLDPASAAAVRGHLDAQWLLVQLDARGQVLDATGLQWPGLLDAAFAGAATAPLGPRVDASGAELALWAPTARSVSVCTYASPASSTRERVPLARDTATGIWSTRLPGDRRGTYSTYLVDVVVPGTGLVRNRVTDPYAVSLSADGHRAYLADLDDPALMPPSWRDAPRPPAPAAAVDMAIYELHVRDFSSGDPAVPAAHRGKYLAFADPGSAGMRHLRGLRDAGLTDVHLLPVFDFATVPETGCVVPAIPDAPADSAAQQAAVVAVAARDCFNWGYDPVHFGAPEGSYATDAMDGAVRIRELRAMVQALHAAGLRVGMDVVYNHTHAAGQAAGSVLDRIVPGYYQRLDAAGVVERSTCCANTATEHAMMARLMSDTLVRWARDYRIDSFRFDLMGHQPRAAMEQAQARLREATGRFIPLIGEGWNFGEVADGARFVQAAQGRLDGTGIATFSDRARDALRGGGCCDSGEALLAQQGWLNGLVDAPNAHAGPRQPGAAARAADLVRVGLAGTLRDVELPLADGRVVPLSALDYAGQGAGYASQPGEVVNYVENHDNLTLYDVNALRLPAGTPSAERARVQLLGVAAVMLSQGVPYFHAGIDLLRSKSLDRNSFDSGDWFNRIDWSGATSGFGAGLPPAPDNGKDWPLLAPVLRDASIRPAPADIAWTRAVFRDWLRLRATTPLLRLRDAAEVQRRLRFPASGPGQDPALIAGQLDGAGLPQARFAEVLYLLNTSPQPRTLALPAEVGRPWVLHPVQRGGADARVREARSDGRGGFTVPGRTAAVFVIERPASGASADGPH